MADPETAGRFFGRRIIAAAFLIQAVALACTFSAYGLFLEPIEAEFGATRAQTLLGLSILNLVVTALGPLIGWAIDRGPLRPLMIAGALLLAGGFALLARATELWQLTLALGLCVGSGVALVGPLPSTTLIANWFVRRRGTALGVAATGVTAAGVFMPPLTAGMIESLGWRGTLQIYGALCAGLLIPVIWALVIKRPEDVGQHPDGDARSAAIPGEAAAPGGSLREFLGQPNFWLLGLVFGLAFSGTATFISNAVPLARSLGADTQSASYVLSCVAFCSLLGKLLFGTLVDRIERRAAMWLSLGLQICAWGVFLSEPGYALLLAASALWGLTMGGLWPMHGALLGAVFGRATFGRAMGLGGFVMLPLSGGIPPLAGHVYDLTGSYTTMLAPFIGVYALSAALLAFVRLPGHGPGARAATAEPSAA
ncbi:MAG: MFS transporter [Proteobacteria bacterium]|nr:MFS transporter [Pseudomonadota bacterium]